MPEVAKYIRSCKQLVASDISAYFIHVISSFSHRAEQDPILLGGFVAQWLRRWIRDRKVHGSIPSRCATK